MFAPNNPYVPQQGSDVSEPFDIERPACFYLGREYDLAARAVRTDRPPVMYDARDLLTHGVVVGMTGSGKTGLCLSILEEAAIDGIPCIILDVKGDLTNLLLQFPDLKPDDFKKWLNPEDARTKKLTLDEYAEQLAGTWRKGLEESGQSPQRIRTLKDSSDWAVYTPGSDAGLSLAILKNFSAPDKGLPREEFAQKIDATVAALLGLTGIVSDPLQSREHVYIAQLLMHSWNKGESLDLAQLITRIQVPPVRTIGAFDVDTFYPEKDRLKLALSLNNLLASPSFATWIEGDPLDLSQLMAPRNGKPRQLLFYLAHLDDTQKMFFLTLLLSEVLGWTRKQAGTTSLRAILYFDEVFGYIPPHPANPPTKAPLMTLLKQARAFGVGILLATQNPVDLDYKALSNAGTWMVGKLQTERDKARLIEGLEGVAAEHGSLSDRGYLERVVSALGNRVFLLHDVHQPKPILMQTRWALSFLRGPMTRDQVAELMKEYKQATRAGSAGDRTSGRTPVAGAPGSQSREADRAFKDQLQRSVDLPNVGPATHVPPGLSPGLVPLYLPVQPPPAVLAPPAGAQAVQPPKRTLLYQAKLLGFAEVAFLDRKRGLDLKREYRLLADPPADQTVSWAGAQPIPIRLADSPAPNAQWAEVPEPLNSAKKIKALQKGFAEFLYASAKQRVFENAKLDLLGKPGEDVQTFLQRCKETAKGKAEAELAEQRSEYEVERAKLAPLVPQATKPATSSMWDMPVLSWFKSGPTTVTLGPKPTNKEAARAAEKLARLDADWQTKQASVIEKWRKYAEAYTEVVLTPRKTDVTVSRFGLAWVPYWRLEHADGRTEVQPAYPLT